MAVLRPHKFGQLILVALAIGTGSLGVAQSSSTAVAPAASGQVSTPSATSDGAVPAQAKRRSTRRSRRRYVAPTASSQSAQPSGTKTSAQSVAPDAAQRKRDAQILAAQKAQSAEIARQNAITTGNVVKERQAQQAEQRIQDAPGPGSQPLAGDPAIQPTQSGDPQGIQDAPGPAQTLPKAPPAQTPQPAPQS